MSLVMILLKEVDGKTTNNAIAMYAKDGEYVEFKEDCLCEGQVEVWLNRLMSTMRSSIRYTKQRKVFHPLISIKFHLFSVGTT